MRKRGRVFVVGAAVLVPLAFMGIAAALIYAPDPVHPLMNRGRDERIELALYASLTIGLVLIQPAAVPGWLLRFVTTALFGAVLLMLLILEIGVVGCLYGDCL